MFGRGFIARWKTRLIAQIPAGDPADADPCECNEDLILTESSETVQTEARVFLREEG